MAIIELTLTRFQGAYGLYSILNYLVLLLHKPVVFVVFKKTVAAARAGEANAWVHSLRTPPPLKARCDDEITKRLQRSPAEDADWIVEIDAAHVPGNETGGIAFGILYLDLHFSDVETGEGDYPRNAGAAIDQNKTDVRTLSPADMARVRRLFQAIRDHTTEAGDVPQLRHLVRYWHEASDACFPVLDKDQPKPCAGYTVEFLSEMIKPLKEEIDLIYRNLRGGEPGVFDENPESLSAAPLLWSRDREAREAGNGRRPPTIAFFLHLREPNLHKEGAGREVVRNGGYRIVPVVTKAIADDLAAAIFDYIDRQEHEGRGHQARTKLRTYLNQLGIENPQAEAEYNPEKLSEHILDAAQIEKFLGRQYYHSFTYPAFMSGISTFVDATPASRCDRVAYGPDFLREKDRNDVAFVKPTNVSGFTFVSFITKTRADISLDGTSDFETFYYDYMFQSGIVRRRLSRHIRDAMRRTYLRAVTQIFETVLESSFRRLEPIDDHEYRVVFNEGWDADLDPWLDLLAHAMPYAYVKVSTGGKSHDVSIFGVSYTIELQENPYFERKLILGNDTNYLTIRAVAEAIEEAADKKTREWTWTHGRKTNNNLH